MSSHYRGFFKENRFMSLKERDCIIRYALFVVLLGCITTPYIVNIFQSLPASDDMSNFMAMSNINENIFISGIKYTFHVWKTWQGTSFCMLVFSWFHPLWYASVYSRLFGIENAIIFCIFVLSVIYLVKICLEKLFSSTQRENNLWISLLILSWALGVRNYPEVFSTYVCTMVYALPCAMSFFMIGFSIKYYFGDNLSERIANKRSIIMLSLLGFLTCQTYFQAVWVCFILLILVIRNIYKKKRYMDFIPFLSCILGALLCYCAPGNFVRHGVIDSELRPMKALLEAYQNLLTLVGELLCSYVFLVTFILIIIVSIVLAMKKRIDTNMNPLYVLTGMLLLVFISCYPLTLGYSTNGLMVRIYFVMNTVLCLGGGLFAFTLGCWIVRRYEENISMSHMVFLIISFIILVCSTILIHGSDWTGLPYYQQVMSIQQVNNCRHANLDIYHQMENSKDNDVAITAYRSSLSSTIISTPDFNEDGKQYPMNAYVEYFNKENISVTLLE